VPPPKDLVRYKEVRVADRRNDQKTAAQILNADAASITQEQLQEFVLSQIKRIIHGDHAGTWKDDFEASGILSLQDLSLGLATFEANCLVTDVVNAAARITGPAIAGLKQVTTCDISAAGGYPAVGLILSKSSPTRCTVQTSGAFAVGPLVPGATYFVGFTGQPALAPLPPSGSGFAAIQSLGVALDVGVLQLSVSPTRFLRSG
jgi:hypothetical protein